MEKKKKIKIISIVVGITVVIVAIAAIVSSFSLQLQYSFMYLCIPDSVEYPVNDDVTLTLYKRKNPDYSAKDFEDNPLSQFEFYYIDENGEEVVMKGAEKLVYNGEENVAAFIPFLPKTLEKLGVVKKTAKITIAVIITVLIVGLIVFWFFRWSKKQDKEKQDKFKAKNNAKRSKNNK